MVERLYRLTFCRIAIVTLLLGITAIIQIKGTESLPVLSPSSVYFIIAITHILSFLYLFLAKKIKSVKVNVYVQAMCDVSLITALVYITGGIRSIYSVLYPLTIIYSVLFLSRKGGIAAASASSLMYGLMLNLEYYGRIHPAHSSSWEYDLSSGDVLSTIFIHVTSFYIVAFLTSIVVEQEKSTRSLLAEKESEFCQLDMLHRSIIESVNAGIITMNLEGKIKSFNKAATEITGFSFSELEGKSIDNIFPRFSEILDSTRRKERNKEITGREEIVIPGKYNRNIVVGFSISQLINSKRENIGNTIIFQDLTATKEMEKAIERSKTLAIIGEMAAGLAHEVRNPLASLSGSIQVLRKNLEFNNALAPTDERLIQIILRGRDQLENLVKDFLLLARPTLTGREQIDIRDLIDDIVESVGQCADWNKDISVAIELCDQTRVYGNKTEMRQIIWNLVLNAVQSMPDGGALIISSSNGGQELQVQISDRGCGIDTDDFSKVFEPFHTTKQKGTGLGLAIVNRLVSANGGRIRIESELQKGTNSILSLPVVMGG